MVAAAADTSNRHRAGGHRDSLVWGERNSKVTGAEPGCAEPSTFLRRDSAYSVHRRSQKDGRVCQPDMGQTTGVDHGGDHRGAQCQILAGFLWHHELVYETRWLMSDF